MAEARRTEAWNHTAALLAMLANVNRDAKKGRAFKPADFHPCMTKSAPASEPALPKCDITILKTVFVDSHPRTDHSTSRRNP